MDSLYIDLGKTDIEFFTSCDKSINICISANGMSESVSDTKEISRETLKSYIDKLQEIYENTNVNIK